MNHNACSTIQLAKGSTASGSLALATLLWLAAAAPAWAGACDDWIVDDAPNPPGARAQLQGLEVIAADDIWAVGYQRPVGGGDFWPLAAHFDGGSWTLIPVPNPAWSFHRDAWLEDVDAAASDDVWAVGRFIHPGEADLETFVVHWDGTEWSWIESPTQPNGEGSGFVDVEVLGANDVWAVGSWPGSTPGASDVPLAAHYDGSAWTITPVPIVEDDTRLLAVEAFAADEIWAIGNIEINTAGPMTPLIVRFDGSTWELVDPAPPADYHSTRDLAVLAPDDVWVAANRWNPNNIFAPVPVFLHWDGSSWTEHASPGGDRFVVNGPDDIRAVGIDAISRWDGSSWSLLNEFDLFPGDPHAFLTDVESIDGCALWGVGKTGVADDIRTLIMHTAGCGVDCAGDLDGDGDVDQADLGILLSCYGVNDCGDLDGDGDTDQADLGALLSNYGT